MRQAIIASCRIRGAIGVFYPVTVVIEPTEGESPADAFIRQHGVRYELHHVQHVYPGNHIADRLKYLRGELRAERISYGELHELQSLAAYIAPGDVELLEAAGVPEFPEEQDPERFDGQS